MLKVENISAGYGEKRVLYDVSFEVNDGEIVLLTGGNGSGKSTVLKSIFGIISVWAGKIYFYNTNITNTECNSLRKKHIVYIPQNNFLFENLTVKENLLIAGSGINKKTLSDKIQYTIDFLNINSLLSKKPFYLSGGEKKLVAFGMSILHNPKLVLFDEPLSGLDSGNSNLLLNKILELNKSGTAFLLVEHKNTQLENIDLTKIILNLGKIQNSYT